ILTRTRDTTPAWVLRLEPGSSWAAHGPTTGAIAIGTTATSTLTITITSTETLTGTSIGGLRLGRATRGSTIRNTEEMRPMGTDKPRIGTVARLAERAAHLELVPAEAPVPQHDPAEGLLLVPVDRVSAEATEQVPVERKTLGPVIGQVPESAREISVAAIALAVGQGPAAQGAGPPRGQPTASGGPKTSGMSLPHPAHTSALVTSL